MNLPSRSIVCSLIGPAAKARLLGVSDSSPGAHLHWSGEEKQCLPVISSDTESTITFWTIDTGRKIKQFSGCHGNAEISTMALDASETRLLTGSTDGTVKIWDFNGHCHHKLNAGGDQPAEISQILVLKRTIIVVGWERIITVFRLNTLTQYLVQPSEWKGGVQHHEDILCAAFLPPQYLITGSYDGEIIVWNNNTENASRKLHPDPEKRPKSKSETHLQSAGKRSLSSPSSGRYTRSQSAFCNTDSNSNNTVTRLFFLGARKHISATGGANMVSCGGSGYVRFWNIFRSQLMAEFVAHEGASFIVMNIDKANNYLVTGDLDGWIRVWNIQEYCCDYSEAKCCEAPPLVSSFQPHSDCVTHIETCSHNQCLLILSSSADCSICVSDVQGHPIGIFGQEDHWRIEKRSFPLAADDDTCDRAEVTVEGPTSPFHEIASESDVPLQDLLIEDTEDLPYKHSPWENTILGTKYRENALKEKLHSTFIGNSAQHPVGTFSLLNIGSLRDTMEMSKPDFIINPHKYFGEKTEETNAHIMEIPTFSETLRVVFDEESLFPRDLLERELKVKELKDKMLSEARVKKPARQKPARQKEK